MATIRGPVLALCTVGSALLALTGCDKLASGGDQDFARAALERNEQLSVVAYDKTENTFTVKIKDTGELKVVRADQIVASIPGSDDAKPATTQPAATTAPAVAAPEPAAPARDTAPSASNPSLAGEIARPADAVAARYPIGQQADSDTGTAGGGTGTGVITSSATGKVLATNAAPDEAASPDAASGRKMLASGPGYSIKAGDPAPRVAIRLASRSSDIPLPTRGVAIEHRYEPMICQGQRLLHIDGRNLEFEGDAISAEDGCEIHITNSHIIAHGVGVLARAANVHIKNSVIEGDSGSVSASQGAQVYTQSTTFKGLSRRLDTASFHDLGGTVWN
ncbi:MAG: hypothetical protein ABI885_18905 [Gammaproteobacteria bacterium]